QLLHLGVVFPRAGGAGADPAEEDAVGPAVRAEELAALVGGLAGRLAEEDALFRGGQAEAPTLELTRDPGVVPFRGVAAQRQAEAVLPGPLAVATALVAAEAS